MHTVILIVWSRGKRRQSFKSVFYSSIFHARSCHLGPLWVLCWISLDIKQLDLSPSSCHYSYQTGTLLAGYIISRMDYQLLFMVLWFSGGSQNDFFNLYNIVADLNMLILAVFCVVSCPQPSFNGSPYWNLFSWILYATCYKFLCLSESNTDILWKYLCMGAASQQMA